MRERPSNDCIYTAAVNTRRVNRIVKTLKIKMVARGFDHPQYTSWQYTGHYILDRS